MQWCVYTKCTYHTNNSTVSASAKRLAACAWPSSDSIGSRGTSSTSWWALCLRRGTASWGPFYNWPTWPKCPGHGKVPSLSPTCSYLIIRMCTSKYIFNIIYIYIYCNKHTPGYTIIIRWGFLVNSSKQQMKGIFPNYIKILCKYIGKYTINGVDSCRKRVA